MGTQASGVESKAHQRHLAIVGHSHMVTLKKALEGQAEPTFSASYAAVTAYEPINDPLPEALTTLVDRTCINAAAICLQLKGNQHTISGLLRQSPEFDVVVSAEPDLHLVPNAQIIPEAAFTSFYERTLVGLVALLKYLSGKANVPLLVLGPPPPIEDSSFIASKLDPYFLKCLSEMGVAISPDAITTPMVRWKLWSILNQVYEAIALGHGAVWLPVPSDAFDQKRFLHRNAWGNDATHANAWFGKLRLQQIEIAIR